MTVVAGTPLLLLKSRPRRRRQIMTYIWHLLEKHHNCTKRITLVYYFLSGLYSMMMATNGTKTRGNGFFYVT